jgi:RNA polymerase sigma-70 factor, ECF subfamily
MDSPELINGLAGANAIGASSPVAQSETEREVMSLFDRLRSPLLRYTLTFGVQTHDAEEIVQEAFLSLFRHLQLRRSQRNLPGWLFRVVHNLALKDRYAKQRRSSLFEYSETVADVHIDPLPDPEQIVSFAQRRSRLLAVVDAMPETDQRCLFLRAEGLGYREIASVVGISLGSVSISLTRTIARLARVEGR